MQKAIRIAALFDVDANAVLSRYRWIRRFEETSKSLDTELARLWAERTALTEKHAKGISERQLTVVEVEEGLANLRSRLGELDRKRKVEAYRIGSFLRRLGIKIKGMFFKGVVGVQDTRRTMEDIGREAVHIEDEIGNTLRILSTHKRALERLTDPLDDLDYAIEYLEEKHDSAYQYGRSLHSEIDNLIRETAKSTLPAVLQEKLQHLPENCDADGLGKRILELKGVTTQADLLQPIAQVEETPSDVDSTVGELEGEVLGGFYDDSSQGRGEVGVSGHGTTYVRKTRTVTSTDSEGRTSTSTETYWDKVRVEFSGRVHASIDMKCSRWRSGVTAEALRTEMERWVRVGKNRISSGWLGGLIDELGKMESELISEIREELERDLETTLGRAD
jgi:hypothetical protein